MRKHADSNRTDRRGRDGMRYQTLRTDRTTFRNYCIRFFVDVTAVRRLGATASGRIRMHR